MAKYPGLGLPLLYGLDYEADDLSYPIGVHLFCSGSSTVPLAIRELAMMNTMETLTDKDDWHKKVFDERIVAKWREEAREIPDEHFWDLAEAPSSGREHTHQTENPARILNDKSFDYCIQELQTKAKYFEKTGLIPTLDAHMNVVKSDSLVFPELHQSLLQAFGKLSEDHKSAPDWHPNTDEMVHDLVHPSMYPLVYGRSRVFNEEAVGVDDAITKWAGKGNVIPKGVGEPKNRWDIPPEYWSKTYQWLPSNVAFDESGSVHLTSYINNLHPKMYPDIYRTIEKLIETSLPMWDQCLVNVRDRWSGRGVGRSGSRFIRLNENDKNTLNWVPGGPSDCVDNEVDEGTQRRHEYRRANDKRILAMSKWMDLRRPVLSSPGDYKPIDYTPKADQRLIDLYRDSGLQVIVKMASIELTPDKPEFPAGGWHVEGQMNEHICATALYYLESENITSSNLSFRMMTAPDLNEDDEWNPGQDSFRWMNFNYGTSFRGNEPCLQNYGSVETREGRLLSFPNIFQHRVSPFRLVDPTKPGHRRFIALWLVDPNFRIISTANVPPQQMNWWTGSVFGDTPEAREQARSKLPSDVVTWLHEQSPADVPQLPRELMDMVSEYVTADYNEMPMSEEEARHHRKELMEERSNSHSSAESEWNGYSYNFCEH